MCPGQPLCCLPSEKNEKDYLLRKEKKFVKATHNAVSKLNDAIRNAGMTTEHATVTEKALTEYKKAFDMLAEEDEKIADLAAVMHAAVRKIIPLVAAITEKAENTVTSETEATESDVKLYAAIASGVGIAALIICASAGLLLSSRILLPISQAVGFAERMSEGNLTADIEVSGKDEISQLLWAMKNLADALNQKAALAERIASGDLTATIEIVSDRDILGKALRKMTLRLQEVLAQVSESAGHVGSGADQVSASSYSLSEGTTEQAASLEQAASSIIEISSRTRSNAENAFRVSQFAEDARETAAQGAKEMANMTLAMEEINHASQSVAKIIKVIDEIAFQTNLLALNAAVEAARAGRHGKGFAVVAEEVRNLAGRSARAAKETSELIEGAVEKVRKGNTIVRQTGEALSQVMETAAKVAELVSEIADSCNEQAQNIDQVNQGLGQIDQVTQKNAATSEENASSAEELAGQASQLRQLLSWFKLDETESDSPRISADHSPSGTSARNQPSDMMPVKSEDVRFPSQTDGRYMAPKDIISLDDEDFEEY